MLQFFDEMVFVGLEFEGIFFPESFVVDWTPLQCFRIDFFDIFIKWAQNSDVTFQDSSNVLDFWDEVFVLDVSLENGVDDLEETVVNHELQTTVVILDILEDHEGNSSDLLSWDFLEDVTDILDDSKFRRSKKSLKGFSHKREHPNIKKSIINELNVIATFAEAVNQECSSSEFQEMFS